MERYVLYNLARDQFFYGFPDSGDAMWTDNIKAACRVGESSRISFWTEFLTFKVDLEHLVQVPLGEDDIPIFSRSIHLSKWEKARINNGIPKVN